MGTAARSIKSSAGGLKAKASYLILIVPALALIGLLWRASHIISRPDISIYQAASSGNYDAVRDHILTGTPVNSLSGEGHSPLYYAVLSGKPDVVELLLQNGAYPNAEGSGETTALYTAAGGGNLRILQDLINAGADVKEEHRTGATPLFAAADSGNAQVVKLLLDLGADPNAKPKNVYGTPLCNACSKGNAATVQLLIDRGAKVNAPGFHGRRPLHYAAQNNHYDVVKALIDSGADPDLTDGNGVLPLSTAFSSHVSPKISWLMFNHMKQFDHVDYHSSNLLNYAVEEGAGIDFVKALLAKGVDPNQVDFLGDSPLSSAKAIQNDRDVIDALIQGGARVSLEDLIQNSLTPTTARPAIAPNSQPSH